MTAARLTRRSVMWTVMASTVTGCGFRPVYAPTDASGGGAAAASLAQISVGLIPERSGQLLRLALQERFERAGLAPAHRYDLAVSFAINSDSLAIRRDSNPSWVRVVGTATYSLLAQDAGRATITSGTARSVDGYNLFANQYFATDQESDVVQRRVAEVVADQIAVQLATFFAKRTAASAA